MRRDALALALLFASALPAAAHDGERVVTGAHVVSGGRTLSPGTIVVSSGRIARVVEGGAPEGAVTLLDASASWVVPGFVDARSGAGLPPRANEEEAEVTPALRAVDLVDTTSPDFDRALAGGVTTVAVSPGGRAVIGGLVGVLKTAAMPHADRVLAEEAALAVTLGLEPPMGNRLARFERPRGLYFRRPGNRMGVVAEVRRAFLAEEHGLLQDPRSAAVLARASRGELPVFFRGRTENDLLTALRLSQEFGLRPVLVDAVEAHRVPEEIASAGAACVLGPFYQQPRDLLELWEGEDVRHGTAKALHEKGVDVALGTGPGEDPGSLRDAAALAARSGLPEQAALDAITRVPARLLGVAGRVGDIAPGRDADFVVLDGPPLSPTSRVVAVVVGGEIVHRAAEPAAANASRATPDRRIP